MFNWSALTLFLFIMMRMSGFVLFSPLFGRNGIPAIFQAGFIGALTVAVFYNYEGTVTVPDNLLTFALRMTAEMGLGFCVAMVMRFFFYIAEQGGEIIDTQMGMGMAKNYDPGAQSSVTTTASLLNILMYLLFFAANGHITLLKLMLTSGEIVPFGGVVYGQALANRALEMFAECVLLALKLAMPTLGAEMLGQVGMGVLMKVIPQINVFAINIELKVIIGQIMLLALLGSISDFLLDAEIVMLRDMRELMSFARG